jgi:hypothetical protein
MHTQHLRLLLSRYNILRSNEIFGWLTYIQVLCSSDKRRSKWETMDFLFSFFLSLRRVPLIPIQAEASRTHTRFDKINRLTWPHVGGAVDLERVIKRSEKNSYIFTQFKRKWNNQLLSFWFLFLFFVFVLSFLINIYWTGETSDV